MEQQNRWVRHVGAFGCLSALSCSPPAAPQARSTPSNVQAEANADHGGEAHAAGTDPDAAAEPPTASSHAPGPALAPSPALPTRVGDCLPLVGGCGCAYACGMAMGVDEAGLVWLQHELMLSNMPRATRERRCFDAVGGPLFGDPAPAANCLEVFVDDNPSRPDCAGCSRTWCATGGCPV